MATEWADPFVDRFSSRVERQPDGCWLWTGQVNSTSPYGRFYAGDVTERWVHRLVYRHFVGPIPAGMTIDHLCNTPLCVNPDHLEAVTQLENVRRAVERRPVVHGAPGDGVASGFSRGCRCTKCVGYIQSWRRDYTARLRQETAAGMRDVPHGTVNAYTLYGCRCDECRRAQREQRMRQRRAKGVQPVRQAAHGSTTMYSRHKCRCDVCREGWAAYWRSHRAKQAAG